MPKTQRHVHERDYFGEADALAITEWLNSKKGSRLDAVEQLIRAGAELVSATDDFAAVKKIRNILRKSSLKLAPFFSVHWIVRGTRRSPGREGKHVPKLVLDRTRWNVDWDPTARGMTRAQSLALLKCLELASKGLLGRLRKCAKEDCRHWFYARFSHQRFHSLGCQQATFRHDPEWQAKRRDYMKDLRQKKKLQEQRW